MLEDRLRTVLKASLLYNPKNDIVTDLIQAELLISKYNHPVLNIWVLNVNAGRLNNFLCSPLDETRRLISQNLFKGDYTKNIIMNKLTPYEPETIAVEINKNNFTSHDIIEAKKEFSTWII